MSFPFYIYIVQCHCDISWKLNLHHLMDISRLDLIYPIPRTTRFFLISQTKISNPIIFKAVSWGNISHAYSFSSHTITKPTHNWSYQPSYSSAYSPSKSHHLYFVASRRRLICSHKRRHSQPWQHPEWQHFGPSSHWDWPIFSICSLLK